jgi:hypothetical protein
VGKFLWVLNTPGHAPNFTTDLASHDFDIIQQTLLDETPLDYDGIVLTMHSDQRHLARQTDRLMAYLNDGGSIIFNGHVAHTFLPCLTPFHPITQNGLESLRIHIETPHPLTEGLNSDDLTFQRSVAGFYGRGTNPAPGGATILTSIGPDRAPVDWLFEHGEGKLYVHAGNDCFSFLRRADPQGLTALRRFFNVFTRGAS